MTKTMTVLYFGDIVCCLRCRRCQPRTHLEQAPARICCIVGHVCIHIHPTGRRSIIDATEELNG